MDPVLNPYSPGAGLRPRFLVGRDAEIDQMKVLVARAERRTVSRGLVLHGLRGVGKTVLLNNLADLADNAGWITARVEARPAGSGERFELQLAGSLREVFRRTSWRASATDRYKTALGTLKSFTVKVDATGSLSASFDGDATRGRADSGVIGSDLADLAADLADVAEERSVGVGIFIDELQDASPEVLRALCTATHAAGQRAKPFYVIGAGLPSLPRVLAEAASYAERLFHYRSIEHLGELEAGNVLTEPAGAEGITWEPQAVATLVNETAGYPYFLQEYGKAAWDVAIGPDISQSDALVAVTEGRASLDAGFFRARWERATKSERKYLAAMATDGVGPSSSAEVAVRQGKSPSSLGPARASLISKGLIYAPEHGQIAYTVPGMADYIRRQL